MICYICGLMSNPIGDYVESNRLMLYREIDGLSGDRTEVIGNIIWGVDLYTDHLFAYRYDGGYRVVSAYINPVSSPPLRAPAPGRNLVCRLLLDQTNTKHINQPSDPRPQHE